MQGAERPQANFIQRKTVNTALRVMGILGSLGLVSACGNSFQGSYSPDGSATNSVQIVANFKQSDGYTTCPATIKTQASVGTNLGVPDGTVLKLEQVPACTDPEYQPMHRVKNVPPLFLLPTYSPRRG